MKKLFAAISAASILLSLCACGAQEAASNQETEQTSTAATTQPIEVPSYPVLMSYADYMKLTPAQQQAYYESFPDMETYMQWFNAAATAHNQGNSDTADKEDGVGQITQPTQTQQQPTPDDPSEPSQQQPTPDDPIESSPKPTTGHQESKDPVFLTYEEYLKLDAGEKEAYYKTFPNHEAYMQWFNQATEEYNKEHTNNEQTEQPTDGPEVPGGQAGSGLEGSASQGEVDF